MKPWILILLHRKKVQEIYHDLTGALEKGRTKEEIEENLYKMCRSYVHQRKDNIWFWLGVLAFQSEYDCISQRVCKNVLYWIRQELLDVSGKSYDDQQMLYIRAMCKIKQELEQMQF